MKKKIEDNNNIIFKYIKQYYYQAISKTIVFKIIIFILFQNVNHYNTIN